ncbi:hypothetical protein JHK87_043967 [Glycine soja]|nr:hypothetical protein JHK87_043967 [Glycine soja]
MCIILYCSEPAKDHYSINSSACGHSLIIYPFASNIHGWGDLGHVTVCKIAHARLSEAAAEAVKKLLRL